MACCQLRAKDPALDQFVESFVHVKVLGRVTDDELHRLYATSKVYCLMSSCESFGIPAAESMTFGTPVISTDCCAISEICSGAGLFGPPNDPQWTADALQRALFEEEQWESWHAQALQNSSRLRWDDCAKAFAEIATLAPPPEPKSASEITTA